VFGVRYLVVRPENEIQSMTNLLDFYSEKLYKNCPIFNKQRFLNFCWHLSNIFTWNRLFSIENDQKNFEFMILIIFTEIQKIPVFSAIWSKMSLKSWKMTIFKFKFPGWTTRNRALNIIFYLLCFTRQFWKAKNIAKKLKFVWNF
jgi:hypothetical protein